MPTNDTLDTIAESSTLVKLNEGETATFTLTPSSFVGTIVLERGDDPTSMRQFQILASNATGVLNGKAYWRFKLLSYTSGSCVSSVSDAIVSNLKINSTIALTQAAYNALATPDPNTLYLIVG